MLIVQRLFVFDPSIIVLHCIKCFATKHLKTKDI